MFDLDELARWDAALDALAHHPQPKPADPRKAPAPERAAQRALEDA